MSVLFQMEEISQIQQNFLHELDSRIQVIKDFFEFKSGSSTTFQNLVTKFNKNIHDFIQAMLDELQNYSTENISLVASYEHSLQLSETFRVSYNNVVSSVNSLLTDYDQVRHNFNEVTNMLIASDNDNQRLLQENHHLRRCLTKHREALNRYAARESSILTYFSSVIRYPSIIDSTVNTFSDLRDLLAKRAENSSELSELSNDLADARQSVSSLQSEVIALKEQNASLSAAKDELETRADLLRLTLQGSKSEASELQKRLQDAEEQCQRLSQNMSTLQENIDLLREENRELREANESAARQLAAALDKKDKFVEAARGWRNKFIQLQERYSAEVGGGARARAEGAEPAEEGSGEASEHREPPEVAAPALDETRDVISEESESQNGEEEEEHQNYAENNEESIVHNNNESGNESENENNNNGNANENNDENNDENEDNDDNDNENNNENENDIDDNNTENENNYENENNDENLHENDENNTESENHYESNEENHTDNEVSDENDEALRESDANESNDENAAESGGAAEAVRGVQSEAASSGEGDQ